MQDGGTRRRGPPLSQRFLLITLLAAALGGCSQQTHAGSGSGARSVTIRHQSGHDPFGFAPKTLTVAAGTRVVWRNRTSQPHTVTAGGDRPYFSSGVKTLIAAGHSWSFTFKKPGRYPYYCIVHPFMKGTIIVRAGPSA